MVFFALGLSYLILIASSAAFALPSPPANITTCPFSAVVRVHPLAVAEPGAPSHGKWLINSESWRSWS
ncbi:hypothetical protein EXIGLDRAFT_724565 [Exidia glandulosa HHB12029]|uniref:Secreted protein n=1 Tax=Exidia glandulosa HHB12029 TaxID=1314781 RepID=A0A165ECV8_EXIGL|nr:hypothetical protein EXIGLDRAFT_724565 [Exidia glandulosa HHB12029]